MREKQRIERLIKQLVSLQDSGMRYWKRRVFISDSFRQTEGQPGPIRKAKAFRNILENAEPVIHDGELIVGSVLGIYPAADTVSEGARIYPDLREFFFSRLGDGLADIKGDIHFWSGAYDIARDYSRIKGIRYEVVLSRMRKVLYDMEEKRRHLQKEKEYLFDEVDIEKGDRDPIEGWGAPHHIAVDYERLLKRGYGGLLDDVKSNLENLDSGDAEYNNKKVFYKAVMIALEAATGFIIRYSQKAYSAAGATEGPRKEELTKIGDICRKVAANPAGNFREALQLFWLNHIILSLQGGIALAAGRFDQYMYPYYKADMESGRINRDDALQLLEALWIKYNEPGLGTVQCVTIGGQNARGADATNDMSHLCVEATAGVKLPYPNLAARCHDTTPAGFYLRICKSLQPGTGLPAIFNDETVIPGLINIGVSTEDARNYCIIGCVETGIPGKQAPYETSLLNLARGLELTFNNGLGRVEKKRFGPATGEPSGFENFESFLDTYKKQIKFIIEEKARQARGDAFYRADYDERMCPFTSALVDGCIELGRDVYQGGAAFRGFAGIFPVGLGTVSDSLAAVKRHVYEEKTVTMVNLIKALRSDFEDDEALRVILRDKSPKYGNDDDYADILAKEIGEFVCREILSKEGPRGEWCLPVMMSYMHNINFGRVTGATPDGRRAGEPLSNGIGPSQGVDVKGPTAVVNSVTKLDHSLVPGGSVLNMMFHPQSLNGDKGLEDLAAFVKSFIQMRGGEIQINVVSTKLLKEAKLHPDKYRTLLVRVSGFSEFFTRLHPDIQDEIITRTEQGGLK